MSSVARPHATRIAFAAVLVACAAIGFLRPAAGLDAKVLDLQFRALRALVPPLPGGAAVLVGVDEASVRAVPEPITLWHRPLAEFLHGMALARPSSVVVDLVLPERSYDAVLPGSDKALLKGLLEAAHCCPVLLAMTKEADGRPRPIHPAFLAAVGERNADYALWPIDRDGVVRRFDDRLGEHGERIPTLAGRVMQLAGFEPRAGLIDFARGEAFDYVPFRQVLDWAERNDVDRLRAAFAGKVVLLGSVLPFADRHRMPVALAKWEEDAPDAPAILLYAQALRSVAGSGLIRPVPAALVAALCLAAALLWPVGARAPYVLALAVMLASGIVAASTFSLWRGRELPVSDIILACAVALGSRYAWETAWRLRERRQLRRSFSGYVSPSVLDRVLAGELTPALGGRRETVCVLFADVRGFTKRSEILPPEAVIGLLNRYFERVTDAIHRQGGTVDKFMGDGIMAFFNAPNPLPNPCASAVDAAQDMVRGVEALNRELMAEAISPLAIGIGIHAGEAVVGHVGSRARHEYTAIGDVVNVSSRLEGVTKEVGYVIVCSRHVVERLPDLAGWVDLGERALKGHTPVHAYGMHELSAREAS